MAQQQKYILLDSLTANYEVKHYTLDTSPYGPKNTIEMYNVFSKGYEPDVGKGYIILFSVLPDLNSKTNWELIDFDKIKGNLFPTKNIFRRIIYKIFGVFSDKSLHINRVKLVKKINNKYYVSKICRVDDFYCMDFPRDMQVATKDFILNTNQSIKPISILKEDYKKVIPYHPFPLGKDEGFLIPDVLEGTYLSNIEEKWGDMMYYFYQFCDDNFIYKIVYIKDKGIVAGAYVYFFYSKGKRDILGGDWEKVIHDGRKPLLWAEELKKEWADKEKELENWKKGK
ncbi:hypothetical protein HMPREF1977_0258 [Capnocytophaga ochracea F0287]|uniref:Uncharacterized protein n=1 Tax=Capnocytophaga ochracea F0287 TaxID=873517 RepID=E4MPE8_CAPOC|nr:hypothetical protein [Capnocytophaga ochracea]EFS98499.1 hypothetical protein HMPREF1977_0258 [Capnocytophaga ochracea F0287]UEB43300.1 hypothetical protein LK419_11000 [Capnocytophaga ochracea]